MRYEADYRATGREVLRSTGVNNLVDQRAEKGAAAARSSAESFRESGEYIDSITVRPRTRMGDRYGVIVTATAPYAQFLEHHYHTIASVVDIIERG